MVRIVTDSTADLTPEQQRTAGITGVPLNVHFGDQVFKDKVELDGEEFFRRLATATQLPTTSQPSPGEFLEAYKQIPADESVISIHIAAKLSGTMQSAMSERAAI